MFGLYLYNPIIVDLCNSKFIVVMQYPRVWLGLGFCTLIEPTLYVLNWSKGKKHIFTFYIIPPHWHDTGSWNPTPSKTRTDLYLFHIVNIMGADDLRVRSMCVSCKIILRWMWQSTFDDMTTSVQVMAWCRQATTLTRANVDQAWFRLVASHGQLFL